MEAFVDLHIHTGLSPCGDKDMTPNNIVNMALIKGLDAIAITDHNSCGNVASCMEVGKRRGLLVIPGMELQTREDIHVICLFPFIENAMLFQEKVYSSLPGMKNRSDIFGEQILYDSEDNISGYHQEMLLNSSAISYDDAYKAVDELGGVFIPAHVDRNSYSVISSLGFMPEYLPTRTVEYSSWDTTVKLIEKGFINTGHQFIHSSDAHYLWGILEKVTYITCSTLSALSIVSSLK
jgi:PHP family Zn ribbon phosphoesterase